MTYPFDHKKNKHKPQFNYWGFFMHILNEHIVFPEISEADNEGLLAVGGDLSEQRLILAYQKGNLSLV